MKNLVGLWPNLFRAIEVAKTGEYSVTIYLDQEYKSGFDDYNSIKLFCKKWFCNFVSDGDIKITIVKPQSYNQKCKCETLEDISLRIKKSLQFTKPELKLDNSSISLIENAIKHLDLSLLQVEKIKQIAATIAQMDFSETIKAYHVVEAIQYSAIYNDDGYNAELKSKIFGDMIQIKLGVIDKDAIKLAIDYLNKL